MSNDERRAPGRRQVDREGAGGARPGGDAGGERAPRSDEDEAGLDPAQLDPYDEASLGSVDLDTEETDDTSAAAERVARGDALDDDMREELGIDNVVGATEVGLGGGLDQAEEARAGITDEEIAERQRRRR